MLIALKSFNLKSDLPRKAGLLPPCRTGLPIRIRKQGKPFLDLLKILKNGQSG
jgi:hypothetical protein